MNFKYIIGSGCSFSDSNASWLYGFNTQKIINLAQGGCGNKYIQDSIIKEVYKLLESGVSAYDILVGVQFTGIARLDFIVSDETPTINNSLDDFTWHNKIDEKSAWIHGGGSNSFVRDLDTKTFQDRYFLNYYKYFMTHTENWYNFLVNIITLQSFLKCKNIKYFFHTGWNLVDVIHKKTFVSNLVKFKQFSYLWNQIEQDRFIFYESKYGNMSKNQAKNYSKFGGMWQYLIERDGINLDNDHPNEYGQKIWGEYLKEQVVTRNII